MYVIMNEIYFITNHCGFKYIYLFFFSKKLGKLKKYICNLHHILNFNLFLTNQMCVPWFKEKSEKCDENIQNDQQTLTLS